MRPEDLEGAPSDSDDTPGEVGEGAGDGGGANIALHTSEEESEGVSSSNETEAECNPEEIGARGNAGDAPADADAEVDVENTLAVAMGSEGATTAAQVPPAPAALTAQELASLAVMGPDGTITCGSAPWPDLPRIGRITTWPEKVQEAFRNISCRR